MNVGPEPGWVARMEFSGGTGHGRSAISCIPLLHNLDGHTNWVVALDFTDDGRTLASGAGDSTVMIWDVVTGKKMQGLNTGPRFRSTYTYVVDFSPDGSSLACSHEDSVTTFWQLGR